MAKDTDEKVAVLWERSEKANDQLEDLHKDLKEIQVQLASLPAKISQSMRDECVTKKEFKAVGTVFGFLLTVVTTTISFFHRN